MMAESAIAEVKQTTPVVPLQTKLPEAAGRRGITPESWHVLKTVLFKDASDEMICTLIDYCKARGLDPLKKPFHIVQVWDSKQKRNVDTIWPSIAETRITAMRTGQYAGLSEIRHGQSIEGQIGKTKLSYPEWAQCSVFRMINGQPREFVGPKVYWIETYAQRGKDTDPNYMWAKRPFGQIDKCAEAAALRAAFPEENFQPTAEEMEGQSINGTMTDVTPPKDGNAGLDEFSEAKTTETVVDGDTGEVTQTDPTPDEKKTEPLDSKPITMWVSADEPARELASLGNAMFVIKSQIKGAATNAMAQTIVNQNTHLIAQIDNFAGDTAFSMSLEHLLEKKKDNKAKSDGPEGGTLV